MQYPINREFQIFSVPNFTGGIVVHPYQDNEAQSIINMEPQRDGSLKTIYGSFKVNDAALNGSECLDLYSGQVDGGWCIIAVESSPVEVYAAVSADFCPELPLTFNDITPVAPLGGAPYWSFCQSSDTANNRIILMTNHVDGLYKWDNGATGALMQTIAAAPANGSFVCQYQGYTMICADNSVFVSDYADPETWPGAQEIQLSGNMGNVLGLAPVVGRVLVICERGLLEMRGTTYEDLSEVIPVNSTIGCYFPRTISTFGNEVAFLHYTGPYIYNVGSMQIQYIGEPLKEWFSSKSREFDLSADARYYWKGHLTRHHYILTGHTTVDIDNRICLVFDRRLNAWFELQMPTALAPWSFSSTETIRVVY